ncbi:MAG: hypothetical protein ACRD10_10135, partial [Terriglobia bacterium]
MKKAFQVMLLGTFIGALGFVGSSFAASSVNTMVYVTNSEGNNVTVINLKTMKAVGNIVVGQKVHGVCGPADGRTVFFTIMSTNTVKIVDTATNEITGSIPLTSHPSGAEPNQCAATPDGHYAVVPMRFYNKDYRTLGDLDIIDMYQKKIVKVLPFRYPHNCYDGGVDANEAVYCESRGDQDIYRLNLKTMKFDQKFPIGGDPRPFAVSKDGKTAYVAVGGFHGFAITTPDGTPHRVELPPGPPEPAICQQYERNTPTHGVALSPDGKELWVTSMGDSSVYAYNIATKTFSNAIRTGTCPNWISFAPNGKYATVSNCGGDTTSIINTRT